MYAETFIFHKYKNKDVHWRNYSKSCMIYRVHFKSIINTEKIHINLKSRCSDMTTITKFSSNVYGIQSLENTLRSF